MAFNFPKLREAFLDSYRERAYNHTFVVATIEWTMGP